MSDSQDLLRLRRLALITGALLVAGFLLPKSWPGYGVAFGVQGTRRPEIDHYWLNYYVAECGFLNRGKVIEHTWEASHGHSWPVGTWFSGWALSFCPGALGSALVISAFPRFSQKRGIAKLAGSSAVILTAIWLFALIRAARLTTLMLAEEHAPHLAYAFALSLIIVLGVILLLNLPPRSARTHRVIHRYWLRFCAQLLLVYLAWLGLLLARQQTMPFVGYPLSLAGAVSLWLLAQRIRGHESLVTVT